MRGGLGGLFGLIMFGTVFFLIIMLATFGTEDLQRGSTDSKINSTLSDATEEIAVFGFGSNIFFYAIIFLMLIGIFVAMMGFITT